jgi:hypothetical protein
MSNTITYVTPQLLAQGLMALRERAVMPRLVNRGYESLAAQRGNVINIPVPSAITARTITPSVTMNSNVDSSPTTVAVTLDQWYEAPFQLSDNDALSTIAGFIPMQASEAIKALANTMDKFILGKHVGIYSKGGTAGTTPFSTSIAAAATARVALNQCLAPIDDRRAVLDPSAEGNFLSLANILQADQRGDQGGIIQGTIGRKLGVDWYMNQNVTSQQFTPGTGWATGFIASTVAGAVGDTTLNIINATASGTIKVGDMFRLTADSANNHGYVVTVAATVSATVAVAITFTPPLKTTVATGATLVVVSIPYIPNLMFHRDAFAFVSRPLSQSQSSVGNIFTSPVDPISGVALRLELSRQYKQDTYSYDVLYGAKLVQAALAAKILG